MNIIRLLLIAVLVYFSLQQNKRSMRISLLIVTLILSVCMTPSKEGVVVEGGSGDVLLLEKFLEKEEKDLTCLEVINSLTPTCSKEDGTFGDSRSVECCAALEEIEVSDLDICQGEVFYFK